ncbi:hypothetical protein Y032_0282g1280 [Ancylostoma ceylanicum]|uniref:Uncharacterized protein n=1 Tax=Ancylostoma ceylanicum TaxID=53326 RepID=A0A016S7P2_9BILA|nr:hypothetical protein Y032_0282g1280 [Ancylostoma ceylanicum]
MWSSLGSCNILYILAIGAISLEMISAVDYLKLDPEQIMKELEQYDAQDAQGAVFDPDVYDSVLDEFARFVRDDHGDEQEGNPTFEKYKVEQKAPSRNIEEQQHPAKVAIARDAVQRGQHKPNRHISLSLLH